MLPTNALHLIVGNIVGTCHLGKGQSVTASPSDERAAKKQKAEAVGHEPEGDGDEKLEVGRFYIERLLRERDNGIFGSLERIGRRIRHVGTRGSRRIEDFRAQLGSSAADHADAGEGDDGADASSDMDRAFEFVGPRDAAEDDDVAAVDV